MSQDPNATQVGGSHYQSTYQHWDLVADNNLPYFPAQITRYTTRWQKKNGVQDIDKAIHYTEKLISLHTKVYDSLGNSWGPTIPIPTPRAATGVGRFVAENKLGEIEYLIFQILFTYTAVTELSHVVDLLHQLREKAEAGGEI
jgi:hypothetical protein